MTHPANRVLPSVAKPDYQVMTKALAPSVFDIVQLSQSARPGGKPGETTWRVLCVAVSGDSQDGVNEDGKPIHAVAEGERFLLLFAGNVVRDETFEAYARAIGDGDNRIGPCTLISRKVGAQNRDTWEIADGTEALKAWNAAQKRAAAP